MVSVQIVNTSLAHNKKVYLSFHLTAKIGHLLNGKVAAAPKFIKNEFVTFVYEIHRFCKYAVAEGNHFESR